MLSLVPTEYRAHVRTRLRTDLIAWLSTVRPNGMPDTVPVWFSWTGDTLVFYSEPNKRKLRNLRGNSQVSLALDDTKGGDDVVRFEATARVAPECPAAHQLQAYVEKYEAHIRRLGYGDPPSFAAKFSTAVVVSPYRFRRWA